MLLHKKNFQDFYKEIREDFPKLKEMNVWEKYDWSPDGCENSLIMSELSEEIVNWVTQGQVSEVQRLMNTIEKYLIDGDVPVASIIYTDFLVTIMEAKKEKRETIKQMMGQETGKYYRNLFNFYRESDA